MIYLRYFLIAINILVIAGMLVTGYSGCFEPSEHPYLSVSGLAFPFFLCADITFFIVWVFLRKRYLLIPAIGILISFDLIEDYSPVNITEDPPQGSLKVLSYNVLGFNNDSVPDGTPNAILQYIIDSKADIVCIQEWNGDQSRRPEQWNEIDSLYPYKSSLTAHGIPGVSNGSDQIGILSKYPVLSAENLPIVSKGNVAGVFTLKIHGKTVRIINVHLESVGLSIEEKGNFNDMVKGDKSRDSIKVESKTLVGKLAHSSTIRSAQADVVAEYIQQHKGEDIILCGDFNDHPLSYTHRTIAKNLIDCYRQCGNLAGYTFNMYHMYVRIDNIMCSENWHPYQCQVDKSVNLSDHYPIFCYFKQK